MKIKILYEDPYLILVEKPQGIPVQKDPSKNQDLLSSTEFFLKLNDNLGRDETLHLINRIDRPVGGIVMMAKNKASAVYYSNAIKNHSIEKHYLAVCCGNPSKTSLTLTDYLKVHYDKNMTEITDQSDGKLSTLTYSVLDIQSELALLKIHLKTGRHHQIRVQLSHEKLPIWGDVKYNESFKDDRKTKIALWAYQLKFKHYQTKECIEVTSTPDFNSEPWNNFKNKTEE